MKKIAIISILLLILSCKEQLEKKTVVRVFDKYLYYEDIKDILPKNMSANDSEQFVQNIINSWIQQQLLVHYAEIYLSEEKNEIQKKVEEYRNTLLISKFADIIINKNLDSNVTLEEISEYYEINQKNFVLNRPIIMGFLIKLPINTDSLNIYKKMLTQTDDFDSGNIKLICTQKNGKFEDFTQYWVSVDEIQMNLPLKISNFEEFIRTKNILEVQDDQFYYILKIDRYIVSGKIAPIEYVTPQITSILIKNRAEVIIQTFKQNKYDEALKNNQIEIFSN